MNGSAPRHTRRAPSRRAVVAGLAATGVIAPRGVAGAATATLRIDDRAPGTAISPWVYGSNEIGTLDGGLPSADLDRRAGVTARRLGGDLMTTYNWVNNASNPGKNWRHENGGQWLGLLGVDPEQWGAPGIVIDTMLANSQAMGAISLLTVPIAGSVAADFGGPVADAEAAPSQRFVPVRWSPGARATDPIDASVADMPQLIAWLVARHGNAASGTGFHGFALDNEPGIWSETHPRAVKKPVTIAEFLRRSIAAATVIKAIDPTAKVFGPVSWGATEFVNFQNASDWPAYSRHGNFLAAYLAAFREASERAGKRLLDVCDVHWYAYSNRGNLYRTEDPKLAAAVLDAPRSLTEPGFREDSWVARALGDGRTGLTLPILPSLKQTVERAFPGTQLALTEFNYGGAGQLVSGLALADALGRIGASGVTFASHWGSLDGWLGQAYRLYRAPDSAGETFGSIALPTDGARPPQVTIYAARTAANAERVQVVVINASEQQQTLDFALASARTAVAAEVLGFDAANPETAQLAEQPTPGAGGVIRVQVPPRAARRYVFRNA